MGDKNFVVELEAREMLQAGFVGLMRRIEEQKKGSKPTHGLAKGIEEWGKDIEGAMGEMAAAKALGVYWAGAKNRPGKQEDIKGYHVRTTDKPVGHLTIRPGDADDSKMILVIGIHGIYRVCGWISAGEAKQREEWKDDYGHPERPSVWAVPQAELRGFEEHSG